MEQYSPQAEPYEIQGIERIQGMEEIEGLDDYGISGQNLEVAANEVFDESMEHQENFESGFVDDTYQEQSKSDNFKEFSHMPPLDPNRKVRRQIMQLLNDYRSSLQPPASILEEDIIASRVANRYAKFLLDHSENNESLVEIANQQMCGTKVVAAVGFAQLEQDIPTYKPRFLIPIYVDTHGLFLELPDDKKILEKSEWTHCGMGMANNQEKAVMVELFTQRNLNINQIQQSETDGFIQIRGSMLSNVYGVYAARVVSRSDANNPLATVGPPNIEFNRSNGAFIISLSLQGAFYQDNVLELYSRKKPETIPYSQPSNDSIKVEDLEFSMRVPLEKIPDPRILRENEADQQKRKRIDEESQIKKKEEELKKNIEKQARIDRWKKGSNIEGSQEYEGNIPGSYMSGQSPRGTGGAGVSGHTPSYEQLQSPSPLPSDMKSIESTAKLTSHHGIQSQGGRSHTDSNQGSEKSMDSAGGEGFDLGDVGRDVAAHAVMQINQRQMREEFVKAILDALAERQQLRKQNVDLQRAIQGIFDKQQVGGGAPAGGAQGGQAAERSGDAAMNEHKYLNTLANVHQVRFNLRETQERYNKMATELQEKLNQKQSRCAEITKQFKQLKRTVALNSYNSRTGNKILGQKLNQWQQMDAAKDADLHQCRLRNIALRNRLANREKALKNKEKLADGLHLIDFQQLKIENQTLNERIEERNEELHKLRKKIVTTVIILTHTREKLQFVQKQNQEVCKELGKLDKTLTEKREDLATLKRTRDKIRYENQRLRQRIGIIDSEDLNRDHDNLMKNIDRYKKLCKVYEAEHTNLGNEIKKLQADYNAGAVEPQY